MFGYVKKDKLLDDIREEIDFCRRMIDMLEPIIEALRRDNASSMTIEFHQRSLKEWELRLDQSQRILNILKFAK